MNSSSSDRRDSLVKGRRAKPSWSSRPGVVNSASRSSSPSETAPSDCTAVQLKKLLVRAGALSVRPADRLVLLALLSFADHRTHECFPTQDSLAVLTGQARSTVIASTRRLETAGLLSRAQDPTTRAYSYRLVDTWADENPNRVIAQQTRARVDEDPTRAGYTAGRSKRARVLPGQLSLNLPAPELTWGASEFVVVPSEVRTTTVVAAANHDSGRDGQPQGDSVRNHTESPLTPPATRGDGDHGSWIFERSAQSTTQASQHSEALARANSIDCRENRRQVTRADFLRATTSSPAKVITRLPFTPQQLGEVFAKHAPERSVLTGPLERRLERRLGYVILDLVRAGFGLDDVARAAQRYEKSDMPFVRGMLGWSSLSTAGRLRDMVALAQKEHEKTLAHASARAAVATRRIEPPPSPEDRAHLLEMARAWRKQGAFAAPHAVESTRAGIAERPPEVRTTA